MVQLLTVSVLLTVLGAGTARADCLVLCPPPAEPPPTEPTPEPDPVPAPPVAPVPPPKEPPPGERVDPTGAQRLLDLINGSRSERGLAPMSRRSDVESIAIDHSTTMAKAGDIWHNDEYFTAATKRRLNARTVGENVAVNESIDDAHARLMRSPGHRANILNGSFVVVGIGVVQRGNGSYYITQDFVEPLPTAAPAPERTAPTANEHPRQAASTPRPTAEAPAAPPTTERREHFPTGIASADVPLRPMHAGAGPSDARSAAIFVALALLTLVALTAARWIRSRRLSAAAA